MTQDEAFEAVVMQPNIIKHYYEGGKQQTIEYWIGSFRVACKIRYFRRRSCYKTDKFIYPVTCREAIDAGFLTNNFS